MINKRLNPFSAEEFNMENVTIPRQLIISSRIEDNSVEMVRKRLRTNLFSHTHYDPSLTGQSAKRHFQGIY